MVHRPHIQAVALGALLFAALPTVAAEYLIAPLIGNRLTVTQAMVTTGSNLDRNDNQVLDVPQLPFDDAIQKEVIAAVTKVDPAATFKVLAFREGLPGVEVEREEPKEVAQKLAKLLAPQVKSGEKQWIVALVPLRAEPRLKLVSGTTGHGKVAGVGFYIDRAKRLRRTDTGETGHGYLAAYANFTIVMVDPATGAIVSQQSVQEGIVRGVAGTDKTHPWDVISAEDKVKMINFLVSREVRRAMPELLAGTGLR